jgi:hypothetical protein
MLGALLRAVRDPSTAADLEDGDYHAGCLTG